MSYPTPTPVYVEHQTSGSRLAVGGLLIVILILAGILGYIFLSNGGFAIRGINAPRIVAPSNSTLTNPSGSIPYPPGDSHWIVLWNSCGGAGQNSCPMNATGWREGGIPDTFDYSVSFTSNVPVNLYFLTLPQYMQFAYCNGKISCVSGAFVKQLGITSIQNFVFQLAEGCADYVAIYQSSGTGSMTPNIMVARNPYPAPTGICQSTG